MITIFTIPKDYTATASIAQRNAVGSWLASPALAGWQAPPQVILMGPATGAAEHAADTGVEHVSCLQTNAYGTPLLSHAFNAAAKRSKYSVLCYLNADIILTPAFVAAVTRLLAVTGSQRWLAVARRKTLEVAGLLCFDAPGWCDRLTEDDSGVLDSPGSIDCFLVPLTALPREMPPFVVGRPCWDNWMIYDAWRRAPCD